MLSQRICSVDVRKTEKNKTNITIKKNNTTTNKTNTKTKQNLSKESIIENPFGELEF
ncbi:hypothetical protein HQ545_02275 [Candidatus Woesearchaeota archaeon]|nr:hypothetical protein [Candidatus Woesearchaeota archaeon]